MTREEALKALNEGFDANLVEDFGLEKQEEFLSSIIDVIKSVAQRHGIDEDILMELGFEIMTVLDGCSDLGPYMVIPSAFEDEPMVNIGGNLHDEFFGAKPTEKMTPEKEREMIKSLGE